jgi:hypothetical protein
MSLEDAGRAARVGAWARVVGSAGPALLPLRLAQGRLCGFSTAPRFVRQGAASLGFASKAKARIPRICGVERAHAARKATGPEGGSCAASLGRGGPRLEWASSPRRAIPPAGATGKTVTHAQSIALSAGIQAADAKPAALRPRRAGARSGGFTPSMSKLRFAQ